MERGREAALWAALLAEQAEAERLEAEALAWIAERRRLALIAPRMRVQEALARSESELLDLSDGRSGQTLVVRFRFRQRRFECVVHRETLQVIDAGVCLDGYDDRFTLESLPGVIGEAIDTDLLHVVRWVGD